LRPAVPRGSPVGLERLQGSRVGPLVDTPRRARLAHHDAGEWNGATKTIPDPAGDILARRVLEPVEIVEVSVIELIMQRSESPLEVREVHHPAMSWLDGTANVDFDPVGMA